jgi:hypothetical protein
MRAITTIPTVLCTHGFEKMLCFAGCSIMII